MTIVIPAWILWMLGFVGGLIAFFIVVVVLLYAYTGYKAVKTISHNFRIMP